jgi:structural maintenance of chromosome 1
LELEQSACKLRLTGIKDEIKHVEKELKKTMPELQKVI